MLLLTNLSYLALAVFTLIDFIICVLVYCLRTGIIRGMYPYHNRARVRVVGFNVTFNNVSVISWRSVLFVEETGETHRTVAGH